MNKNQRTQMLCALGLALMGAGCFSNTKDDADGSGSSRKPIELPGVHAVAVATLVRADSCDDLLAKVQDDVIAKIDAQAVALKKGPEYANSYYGGVGRSGVDDGFSNGGAAEGPQATPGNTGGAGTGGNADPGVPTDTKGETGSGSTPTGHSDTNTQVEGVDEADIVKIDEAGKNIYLVHGNTLFALAAWPPESTTISGDAPIEGQAIELFVNAGKAVVFSTIYNYGDIVPLQTPSNVSYAGAYYQPFYSGAPFTKITSFDVTGDTPKVQRELYVEGSYLSSRRHGDVVRAIMQGGFHTPPVFQAYIEYTDPWGDAYPQEDIDQQVDNWRERMVASIEATQITDWVPVDRERKNGELVAAAPRCVDFFAPPPALTSYGLTNIVSFDMSDPSSKLGGAVILGSADTVYANDSSLVLAQRDYRYTSRFMEREQTVLHLFDLDADTTRYHASGFVPGHIANQFSMDMAGDTLRIATTQDIWQNFQPLLPVTENITDLPMAAARRQTDNRVLTLQATGETLARIGVTTSIGEDGEHIESARFVGDRGYVTTFRQIDPLSVVELSDPKHPSVLGELTIPGFSQYMHPLDAGHLVTIGRNTDLNGRDIGLLLQIFDVSDALHPMQTHTFPFAPDGWSEASGNHKAFTYWVPDGETDGLLAFPYTQYSTGFQSTLQVFRVSTSQGFTQLGAVDHTPLFAACYDASGNQTDLYYTYQWCQQPEVRRGLFVQDEASTYVYSVSYGGVIVSLLEELGTSVASASLPAPDYDEHREGTPTTNGSDGKPVDAGVGTSSSGTAGAGAVPASDPAAAPAADGGMAEPQP